MLQRLIKPDVVYIKVFENKVHVRNCDGRGVAVSKQATEPFSSSRSLVGNFNRAEILIKESIKDVVQKRLLQKPVAGIIQGKDKCEGGYSQVEERVLRELAYSAGCFKVEVWFGADLNDQQVLERSKSKSAQVR